MDKASFLSKIAMAAGVFAALAFTSCSDDKGGGTGKWCVYLSSDWGDGEKVKCGEIGAKLSGKVTLTEEWCNNNYTDSSIEDEKPEGCEVITD